MSTIILYFSIYASEQEIVVVVMVHYPLLPRNTRYDYSHNVICAIGTNCCYVMNNSELLVPHVCNHRLRRDYFPCRLIYEQTSWRLDTMMMMVFVSATWWFLHSPVERIGRSTTNSAASSSFHGCFLTYQIIRIVVTAFTAIDLLTFLPRWLLLLELMLPRSNRPNLYESDEFDEEMGDSPSTTFRRATAALLLIPPPPSRRGYRLPLPLPEE